MNNQELNRKLLSIGKECFIRCYHEFKEFHKGNLSEEQLQEQLIAKGYAKSWRVPNAKYIFDADMQKNALQIVITSRVPNKIKEMAENIINTDF